MGHQKREEEAHASSSFYAYRGFESPLRKRAGGTFLGRGVSAGPRFPAAVGRGASQSIPPGPDGSPNKTNPNLAPAGDGFGFAVSLV